MVPWEPSLSLSTTATSRKKGSGMMITKSLNNSIDKLTEITSFAGLVAPIVQLFAQRRNGDGGHVDAPTLQHVACQNPA
jgi:hypothetical protein